MRTRPRWVDRCAPLQHIEHCGCTKSANQADRCLDSGKQAPASPGCLAVTCVYLAHHKAVPRLEGDACSHLAHKRECQAVAKVQLAAHRTTQSTDRRRVNGRNVAGQPGELLLLHTHTHFKPASNLLGIGSVPRGRLSCSSSLRVVSFCSMMVAREASSSTSCHLASVVMSYNSHSQGCALCACKLTAAGRRRGARSRPPPSHACWCFTVMLLHFKQRPG